MKSIKGCPFCQQHIINIIESNPAAIKGYQYQCDNCGACGPIYENKKEALEGWELGIKDIFGRLRKS
jgi:Lar family restriction alleviation protein